MMGPKYRFFITFSGVTIETTPKNWNGIEVGLSRTNHVVDKSITKDFEFIGEGASMIGVARLTQGMNAVVTLRIDRRNEDWTYTTLTILRGDMTTFFQDGEMVRLGFMESTVRQTIEDNMDTVYEIAMDEDYRMTYTGPSKERENILTVLAGGSSTLPQLTDRYSYMMLPAARTTAEYSEAISFYNTDEITEYDETLFRIKASKPITIHVEASVNILFKQQTVPPGYGKLGLYRVSETGNTAIELWSVKDTETGQQISSGFAGGFYYRISTFKFTRDVTVNVPQVGAKYFLAYTPSIRVSGATSERMDVTSSEYTIVDITENAVSPYTNRPVKLLHPEKIIEKLMAKMGLSITLASGITYSLPTEASTVNFLLAFSSCDGLMYKDSAKMSVSLSQIMSVLYMKYRGVIEYTSTGIIISDALNYYTSTEEIVEPVESIEVTGASEHLYGSVEIGYKTDSPDADAVKKDVICKNTYRINNGHGGAYSLSTDVICSPYCIESRIDKLLADESNSDSTDNSIFCFVVYPLSVLHSSNTTALDKRHSGFDTTYFNLELSPMRIIHAHGRFIGTSTSGGTLTFASTERSADCIAKMDYDSLPFSEKTVYAQTLALFNTPVFLPYNIDVVCHQRIASLSDVDTKKLFVFTEEKRNKTVKGYINVLTLQISSGESQKYNLLATVV